MSTQRAIPEYRLLKAANRIYGRETAAICIQRCVSMIARHERAVVLGKPLEIPLK